MATDLVINEFMADNATGYVDPAFPTKNPDWIEIYNPTASSKNLAGWKLKDGSAQAAWVFPSINIAAGGYLVVAADGKNLTNTAAVLHTDFSLDKDGEYLGLLRPDNSVASEFSPLYPGQSTDVSYGVVPSKITTPLVSANGVFKAFVPTDNSLGTSWRNEAFDDSGWIASPAAGTNATTLGGIGFDNDAIPPQAPAGWTVKMVDTSTGSLTNVTQATTILDGNTSGYTIASTTTNTYVDIDFLEGGHFSGNRALPNGAGTGTSINAPERTNYALRATAKVFIPQGTYTIGVGADDGFQITIPGVAFTSRIGENNANGTVLSANNQLTWAGTRGGAADTLGTFTVPAGGLSTTIQLDYFNNTNSNSLEVGIASGLQTGWGAAFVQLKDAVLNGAFGSVGVRTSGPDPTYTGLFATDLKNQMQPAGQPASANATAYLRMPFTITDDNLASITSLLLHMKYDDAFVAYINGTQVAASANAPGSPTWNSTATGSRADSLAVIDQDFTISNLAGMLHVGTNYLTIQAMNASALDSDFLMIPTLDGVSGLQDAPRFFSVATPGTANNIAYNGKVADTKFDHDRGFYDAPFNLVLSTSTGGATIRYTTDGSEPTEINGAVYGGPINISKTTTLRARAFKNGLLPTNLDTQTYIFVADVVTQQASNSNSGPQPGPGWPVATQSGQVIDYGMDPDVVNSAAYGPTIKNDLKTIPTLSIVTDTNNLFGANGIYTNPSGNGITWERPASLELINPDGSKGFQIDFGLRIRGGFSRDPSNPKHGLRVLLRDEYGGTELDYPLFKSMDGTDSTRGFDLRTFENYSWSFQNDNRFIGLRDQFSRDTQNDMGDNSERGDMYNLYIDGVYWGIYNTAERPEADYGVSYYGGQTDDYDVIKVDPQSNYTILATDGNVAGWNDFWGQTNALKAAALAGQDTTAAYQKLLGNNPDGTRNPAYPVYLDAKNLIDYMLIIFYGGNLDAPISNFLGNTSPNNFYALWNHNTKAFGFQYFAHDSEHTLLNSTENRLGPYSAGTTQDKSNPQWIFQNLLYNPDFRQMAADIIHKEFYNSGTLTPTAAAARFNKRRDEINRATVAESARWGDAKTGGAPYTYQTWQTAINTVLNSFFPQRTANMIQQFKTQAMGSGSLPFTIYGSLDAPEFAAGEQFGGTVANGYVAHLTNPGGAGTIYYTTDGTDPRKFFGSTILPAALNPNALVYNAGTGIVINGSVHIMARIRNGNTWSPLTEVTFASVTPPPLRITEIMYHPADPAPGSGFSASDFEYIELQNISASPLQIGKFSFTNGITFTFPNQVLAAGAKVLIVSNLQAFQSRYPGNATPIAGVYAGHLDNGGEKVRLAGTLGETIQSFSYSDSWYENTDGEGFSIVARDPNQALALFDGRTGWRASNAVNGDPGSDVAAFPPDSVVINEIAANVATPNTTWIELRNTTNSILDISNWFLSNDPALPKKYQIPAGTTIPANGYLVLNEQTSYGQAAGSPGVLTSFTFDGSGGNTIVLSQADGAGTLLGYRQVQDYTATGVGQTVGRYVKSTGGTDFVIQTAASQGAVNAGPVIGPAIINEVMYGPVATFGGTKFPNPNLEYVEIRNVTNAALQLFDPANPANTWRISGGLTFQLPQGISIPAYSYIVLTNLLPQDFRTMYPGFPAGVAVFGPVSGFLDNSGEKFKLERPGTAVNGVVPYITVDTLSYGNSAPWPTPPNEVGPSLTRKSPLEYGNDPINWQASTQNGGTPGKDNLISSPPVVNGGPDGTSVEGAVWTQGGSYTDIDLGQTIAVSQVTWGDGQTGSLTVNADKTFTLSHLYKDNGTYTITITLTDSGGGIGIDQVQVTVTNLPPTATFAPVGATSVAEGGTKQVSFTNVTDPGPNDITGFKYSYDWDNDGTYDLVNSASSSASIPASFLADGPAVLTIKGRVTDKDGGSTEYTTTVTVNNRVPVVTAIPDQTSPLPFTLNYTDGSFSDLGADTWVGTVDWDYHPGDTDAVPLPLNPDKTFVLNHAFASAGTFVVRVQVTDKDGGVGFKDFAVTVEGGGGDVTPPTVTTPPQFLYASGPRKITVGFSEDVSASLQSASLTVKDLEANADISAGLMSMTYDANTNTATWTFSSLPDANFRATLHAAGIHDAANNPLASDSTLDFWFLNGDTDRDRVVGFTDMVAVAQHYDSPTGTFATGDVDGDGAVGFGDLVVVAQNYDKSLALPTPASVPAPAPVVASAPVTAPVTSSTTTTTTTVVTPPPVAPAKTPPKAPVGAPPSAFSTKKPVTVAAKPAPVQKPKAVTPVAKPASTATVTPFSVSRIATPAVKKRSDLFD